MQILRADHWSLVSEFIRCLVDDLDAYTAQTAEESDEIDDSDDLNLPSNSHTKLGSKQPKKSLEAIEQEHVNDASFNQFCEKLNTFLNSIPAIKELNIGSEVKMLLSDKVSSD
jgi:hypothetical protein